MRVAGFTAAGLAEPLSASELEVLQLVAAGKPNRQIAEELFVSVGTVKTHVNSFYRKLDVHSRTQAVMRARELKLL
jgi:LuxR family transcriptional regulator, maltose regulon positive regulatory protein